MNDDRIPFWERNKKKSSGSNDNLFGSEDGHAKAKGDTLFGSEDGHAKAKGDKLFGSEDGHAKAKGDSLFGSEDGHAKAKGDNLFGSHGKYIGHHGAAPVKVLVDEDKLKGVMNEEKTKQSSMKRVFGKREEPDKDPYERNWSKQGADWGKEIPGEGEENADANAAGEGGAEGEAEEKPIQFPVPPFEEYVHDFPEHWLSPVLPVVHITGDEGEHMPMPPLPGQEEIDEPAPADGF